MNAIYNEIEPYAAEWIENLAKAGHVANGTVLREDVRSLTPAVLKGYTQAHFFAGIAGWSYALRLAGWSELGDARRQRGGRYARTVPSAQGEGTSERVTVGNLVDESVATSSTDYVADAERTVRLRECPASRRHFHSSVSN